MKTVRFMLLRHGKNVAGNLPQAEIDRARSLGNCRDGAIGSNYTIDVVVTSPLPRAIQTARSVVVGSGQSPRQLEVRPEFGSDVLFADMTSPADFRKEATTSGNYGAVLALHHPAKVEGWRSNMIQAFDGIFNQAEDGQNVLLVIHSPSIEMTIDGLFRRQNGGLLPKAFSSFSELETAVVVASQEKEGDQIIIKIEAKLPAPEVQAAPAAV